MPRKPRSAIDDGLTAMTLTAKRVAFEILVCGV
jgi:hypothetical protein